MSLKKRRFIFLLVLSVIGWISIDAWAGRGDKNPPYETYRFVGENSKLQELLAPQSSLFHCKIKTRKTLRCYVEMEGMNSGSYVTVGPTSEQPEDLYLALVPETGLNPLSSEKIRLEVKTSNNGISWTGKNPFLKQGLRWFQMPDFFDQPIPFGRTIELFAVKANDGSPIAALKMTFSEASK